MKNITLVSIYTLCFFNAYIAKGMKEYLYTYMLTFNMKQSEFTHIAIAIITLTIILSLKKVINNNPEFIAQSLFFALLIISINIAAKKIVARSLDSDVEHEIWQWQRFGFRPERHLKKPIPAGVILPLFLNIITLGIFKPMTFLTYETSALKRRAAKRFGFYSYTEMTDWHNGLIGAAGISALLILSFISYFVPFLAGLPKYAAYYALFNLIPISKLDGTQIFFGSKILWATLSIITLLFTYFALIIA